MKDEIKNKHEENYYRWTEIAINQLGYVINLLLVMTVAAIGFGITFWNENVTGCSLCLLIISLVSLCFSFLFGGFCTITRLLDFRYTRRAKRYEWTAKDISEICKLECETYVLGKWTWRLFWFQLGSFAVGVIFLVIATGLVKMSVYDG